MDELILIEKSVFTALCNSIRVLHDKINRLYSKSGLNTSEWMDNQQVCFKLDISKQALYKLRISGALKFTSINSKYYYKVEDINDMLLKSYKT